MNKYQTGRKGVFEVLLTVVLAVGLTQACFGAAATDQKTTGKELLREFSGGKLYKMQYADGTLKDVLIYDTGTLVTYDPDKHSALFPKTKITDRLRVVLDKSDKEAVVPVSIWIADLDYTALEKAVKEELQITDLNKMSAKQVELYVSTKRAKAKKEYTVQNAEFVAKYLDKTTVLLTGGYAPLLIAKINGKAVEEIVKDDRVLAVDLFTDAVKKDETAYSIPNINAHYTRNTLGLDGDGVKVGILESGYPDKTNSQLSGCDLNFDISDSEAARRLSSHATKVTAIVAGATQGIVPAATIYEAAGLSRLQDYEKIEWLIDQGVKVINFSAGYSDVRGEYSDMAKWIDHLANHHLVHFVKSAGNYSTNYLISDPGMAYNALVVGAINDNDSTGEPYWSDDAFSTFSCYTETSGGYKPDLTAPGQGIAVAGYSAASGTSYAAPHLTAVLAQLLDYNSNLIINNALLKAIMAAGTNHRTAADYGSAYSLSPYYSNKEGAGVIDAKAVSSIAANSAYVANELSSTQFPYYINFTVAQTTNPVRVSLAWLKQNTIAEASHVGAAVTERSLSDLDLTVYNPSGVAVASSVSGSNNLELVQFTPSVTGTYRIKIIAYALQNSSEKIGVAWYQTPN
jgi:serine protease AprX